MAILPSRELGYRLRCRILDLNSFPEMLIATVSQSPELSFREHKQLQNISVKWRTKVIKDKGNGPWVLPVLC